MQRFLTRDPDVDEVEAFVAATEGCGAAGTCELATLPQALCEAFAKSAEYLHY